MTVAGSGPDLVTGATGFIGRHLAARLLREGRAVRALCREGSERKLPAELLRGLELARGDLRDRDSLMEAARGAGRVFHCAGHVSDWGLEEEFRALNVTGTRWLLEAAKAGGARRFVHLSSIASFGTPSPAYFDDGSPYGASRDAYSRTKVEGERAVFSFHSEAGLPVTVLRPAVVYGPDGTWLEEPLRMIERGGMFLIGGGRGTCHPCYIENLVDAILLAADHPRAEGQGYIVADDDPVLFRDYFNAVARIAGKREIRRSIPLPVARAMATVLEATARHPFMNRARPLLTHAAIDMISTSSRTSIRKIRDELGFRPRYRFGDAVEELARWYQGRTAP